LQKKLSEFPDISYKKLALAAEQAKNKNLAIKLLENEKSLKERMPMLIQLKQYEKALDLVIKNLETDYIYGIFSEMKREKLSDDEIIKSSLKIEGCFNFLLSYAQYLQRIDPEDTLITSIIGKARSQDPADIEMMKKVNCDRINYVISIDTRKRIYQENYWKVRCYFTNG